MQEITGKTLIEWGFEPGPWFAAALKTANQMRAYRAGDDAIYAKMVDMQPEPPVELLDEPVEWSEFVRPETEDEKANCLAVTGTMVEVMRTPCVTAGAVMPDACPAGPKGNIPVGGVVASPNIHPGMHSADVCCSVATSVVDMPPDEALDRLWRTTHFGRGPRNTGPGLDADHCLAPVRTEFERNPFLRGLADAAVDYLGTQGDGNHFAFVGVSAETGNTHVVTHHGSRKPGADLYRRGMRCAEQWRKRLSPGTPKQNAWIPADSEDAVEYWRALHAIRLWTRINHFCLHDFVRPDPIDRYWNEHNFVFARDGLYYHAKGATPVWPAADVADDPWLDDRRLVPLNMAEPVLVVERHASAPDTAMGFAPHGAGRNFSRTEHRRRGLYEAYTETKGLDIRWFSGEPDTGELPSAYKTAATVRAQIESMRLARVVDEIRPYGCIMAGQP